MDNVPAMESAVGDEAEVADETVSSVMGSESSKLDIAKEPLVSSTQGQFHRVLVEPDYSILEPPNVPPPDVPDLNINGKTETATATQDQPTREEVSTERVEATCNGDFQQTLASSDEDIIEASRRIVERSIAEAVKAIHDDAEAEKIDSVVPKLNNEKTAADEIQNTDIDEVPTEAVINDKADLSDEILKEGEQPDDNKTSYEVNDSTVDIATTEATSDVKEIDSTITTEQVASPKKDKKSKKQKAKEQYMREREVIDSVKQFMKEEEKKSKEKKETKKGINFPSMFKFSRRKQKSDIDIEAVTTDDNGEAVVIKDKEKERDQLDTADNHTDRQDVTSDTQSAAGRQHGIKRLNSLDSGIVVDKYCDNMNGVEYSVVNKTKRVTNSTAEANLNGVNEVATTAEKGNEKFTEPVYVNGEKIDEDFVYINERAVDVVPVENESRVSKDEDDIDAKTAIEQESNEPRGEPTKVKKVDQIRRAEKFKIKKKSWSFQFSGNKKTSQEPNGDGVVSMDPGVSSKEPTAKKSRWRLGKFSFRRAEDLSASTPDLNKESALSKSKSSLDSEVSESPEHGSADRKKGTKLKKIKAKKEKKQKLKDAQVKSESDIAVRSSSLTDVNIGMNIPRSRRSIVEDEITYTQTDAFEGVAVSDLSQDEEDAQVSLDPSGSETKKSTVEKRVEAVPEIRDVKDEKFKPANEDTTAGVYVNITKGTSGKLESEVAQTEPGLPSKYIYAGDDEYAQIIKTEHGKDSEKEKEDVPLITTQVTDIDNVKVEELNVSPEIKVEDKMPETKQTESVDKEIDIKEENVDVTQATNVMPVEETIVDQSVSDLECKAVPDSSDQNPLKPDMDQNDRETVKTIDNILTSDSHAYSNLIYSDDSFISELKDARKEQDSESDAYVQLEQLVKDISEVPKKEKPSTLDINVKDNNINLNQGNELTGDSKDKTDTVESPVSPTVISRASIKLSLQPKVLIMKEVGVQAPDIHMPLDREYDFGLIKGKPNVVSIGVQVSEGSTDNGSNSNDEVTKTDAPTAYF